MINIWCSFDPNKQQQLSSKVHIFRQHQNLLFNVENKNDIISSSTFEMYGYLRRSFKSNNKSNAILHPFLNLTREGSHDLQIFFPLIWIFFIAAIKSQIYYSFPTNGEKMNKKSYHVLQTNISCIAVCYKLTPAVRTFMLLKQKHIFCSQDRPDFYSLNWSHES